MTCGDQKDYRYRDLNGLSQPREIREHAAVEPQTDYFRPRETRNGAELRA
jgi:hypothetical protein